VPLQQGKTITNLTSIARTSKDGSADDRQRKTSIPKMERPIKKSKLPKTDSIQELAEFWDTHGLTDFEEELEEVAEPVFVRGAAIKVPLESREVENGPPDALAWYRDRE
jgi:hypothetical protein